MSEIRLRIMSPIIGCTPIPRFQYPLKLSDEACFGLFLGASCFRVSRMGIMNMVWSIFIRRCFRNDPGSRRDCAPRALVKWTGN